MEEKLIDEAVAYIHEIFREDCSGHDFYHSMRVFTLANRIAETVDADRKIVRLTALLHDVDDRKLFQTEGLQNAVLFMRRQGLCDEMINRVSENIRAISFKGSDTEVPTSLEGKVVQDADRIDAMGAIGVARTFAYGGSHNRELYNPDIAPRPEMNAEEYYRNAGSSINHFYEKLLKLKDMMNTDEAKRIAEQRHSYMLSFLDQFFAEWNGER